MQARRGAQARRGTQAKGDAQVEEGAQARGDAQVEEDAQLKKIHRTGEDKQDWRRYTGLEKVHRAEWGCTSFEEVARV